MAKITRNRTTPNKDYGARLLSKPLLSKAVFPQRFSFFTVYFVQWLHGVTPRWTTKGRLLDFRSVGHCKMHFSWSS